MLLPPGVQTEKVVLKGELLQLECIPGGLYVSVQLLYPHKLLCSCSDGTNDHRSCCSPTPKVKWIKMGEKLPPRTEFNNFGRLLILSEVEENDGGKYMCQAQNSAGAAVHYFDVMVEGACRAPFCVGASVFLVALTLRLVEPPKWLTEPPQDQLSVIGSDVHIKCSVRGKPPPDITWKKNGELFIGEWELFWRCCGVCGPLGQWTLQFISAPPLPRTTSELNLLVEQCSDKFCLLIEIYLVKKKKKKVKPKTLQSFHLTHTYSFC